MADFSIIEQLAIQKLTGLLQRIEVRYRFILYLLKIFCVI